MRTYRAEIGVNPTFVIALVEYPVSPAGPKMPGCATVVHVELSVDT